MSQSKGSKGQLTTLTGALNGKPLPEGFHRLTTSAGNGLGFESMAELNAYRAANASQFPVNGGTFDDRTKLVV